MKKGVVVIRIMKRVRYIIKNNEMGKNIKSNFNILT